MGVDCISSMPDVILHHILSFIPICLAIRSSALSRRWRHVWCETPRLDFRAYHYHPMASVRDINQTLVSYKSPKITSFHLSDPGWVPQLEPQINSWIEFAVSRNVEQLFMSFGCRVDHRTYRFPNSFYRSSSLENLRLDFITIPGCTVSWKSLRSLTLDYCFQSLDDVLSGCPVLESLTLGYCGGVRCLDLSKSPTLTILKITRRLYAWENRGSMEIVAPHLRFLELSNSDEPCTLVDVSSLTKAKIDIHVLPDPYQYHSYDDDVKADFLRLENMLLKMLAQLQNVEQLTFETTFLQIISLAELRGVPFPMLKVQTLTLHTMIAKSVTPGITTLLQSSPALKKLIVYATEPKSIEDRDLDVYLDSQGMNLDQCWRSKCDRFCTSSNFRFKDATCFMALFIEWLLKNVETLETLVVVFEYLCCSDTWFEELLRMLPTLSNNKNVSIVLRRA
ncbi:hypothetical protein HA466_0323080 [Hirschfeldia incana]|nr:hypothetical protein HA466_0323080 [Hirschfeldia incana]